MGTSRVTPLHVAIVATAAILSALLVPAEAHADGGWPPPPVSNDGTATPTPGGGGGGGTPGTPTPAPDGQRWVNGSIPLSEDVHNFNYPLGGEGSQSIAGYCAPVKVAPGVWWYATGASWTYLVDDETGAYAGGYSFWCWMPPAPTSSVVRCVTSMTGTGERVHLTAKVYNRRTVRTAWSANTTSVANCEDSAARMAVSVKPDSLGAFRASVAGRFKQCTRWDFPGTSRGSIIKGCGPEQSKVTEARMSVFCGDGRLAYTVGPNSWNRNQWNTDHCLSANQTGASCMPAGAQQVRFNGRATRGRVMDGMRSNKAYAVEFGPFRTRGLSNIRKVYSRVEVTGTPSRPGSYTITGTDGWTKGVPASHTAAWVNPGVEGKPFVMQREVDFTGDMTFTSKAITGLNFLTGEAEYSNVTRTIVLDGLTCQSDEVAVDLYRARLNATTIR